MNLQESIRRILREIEEDRIQIRLGRSAERHFGTVQNIIIQVDNEDITGQDGEPGLGKMNIVIKDGEIIVGDIFIPEKYRRQGIATQVYQKISDHFGLPIVNSKTKGFNQTMEGGYMWKDREKFEPRNLQESIRRIVKEVRVPRNERVELYKDNNIIVVVPLTHRALKKYAHQCQWCINSDLDEWEDYHKGKHAVIIQRNPKKPKMGITGHPTASEIFFLAKWDNGESDFDDICQILDYEFRNDRTMADYYTTISNDINNFGTNIVYYSPENGVYDQEDNFLWNFNYEISDIPNVTPEVIKIMDNYLQEEEGMNLQESIRNIVREELNESAFFFRRINLDEVKKRLPINAEQVYGETKSYEQFKYELTLRAVEAIMWNDYELGWEDLPEQEEIEFVNKVSNMFNKTIKKLYNSYSGRILKEEISQKGKDKLINMIKRIGVEKTAKSVGEVNNLYEILNINSPMEFLHLFDDLEQVQSEMDPNLTLFRYKPKNNLIIYDRKNKTVYINFEEIWKHLLEAGLFNFDIKELIKEWLSSVYNIRGVKPRDSSGFVDAARVV